jgi:hypothetical protein
LTVFIKSYVIEIGLVVSQLAHNIVGTISMGHTALDWHFEPGALVNERIAVRDVFQIPDDADVQVAADQILDDLHKVSDTFGRFAGNFIWSHT